MNARRTGARSRRAIAAAFGAVVLGVLGLNIASSSASQTIAQQVAAATQKCSGATDSLASNYGNQQLRAWLRGTQVVPVRKSIWGNAKTSPLAHTPKPWKVGFSNSYAGNAARQAVVQAVNDQTAAYKKAGLVEWPDIDIVKRKCRAAQPANTAAGSR